MNGFARSQDFEPMSDANPPILVTAIGVENPSLKLHSVVSRSTALSLGLTLSIAAGTVPVLAQSSVGTVVANEKISALAGLVDQADPGDWFGRTTAGLGDVDGDGVPDVAIGSVSIGPTIDGCFWVLAMNADDTVKSRQKIGHGIGGFDEPLLGFTAFSDATAGIGDLDMDGVPDLAVAAPLYADQGRVWILFLAADGSVRAQQAIAQGVGGFLGALNPQDRFGTALAPIGDLDGDGVLDLAIGADLDDDAGPFSDVGAVWICFLNADGTVKAHQKISATAGGFTGAVMSGDAFGQSLANIGDLDGDGVVDLAVGAPYSDAGGGGLNADRGAVWILLLNPNGTVKAHQEISATAGGFTGVLDVGDFFGTAVAPLGDLDQDGVPDIVVGAENDDDSIAATADGGAAWILFLHANGTVKAHQKISATAGGFSGGAGLKRFGSTLATAGDLDGDGSPELLAGTPDDKDGGLVPGTAWLLHLSPNGTIASDSEVTPLAAGITSTLDPLDEFGTAVAALGDVNGDGVGDLASGVPGDNGGQYPGISNPKWGSVFVCMLNPDGTVAAHHEIDATTPALGGGLANGDLLGSGLAGLGDIDGDGVPDLAAGAPGEDDGGSSRGGVWILRLNVDGSVKAAQAITDLLGGFTGVLDNDDTFGASLAGIGDLDGDGVRDLAVGAPGDDDGPTAGTNRGAVWILFLNPNGTVKSHAKISPTAGGFTGLILGEDRFGSSVAALGDVDGDGVVDLAVGTPSSDEAGFSSGSVWIVFLKPNGSVKTQTKISATTAGFTGTIGSNDSFGASVCGPGDLNGDGTPDLAAGAIRDSDTFSVAGSIWSVLLFPDGTVKGHAKISASSGGFTGMLGSFQYFGRGLAGLGNLDGAGGIELAAGAPGANDAGDQKGAVWMLHVFGSPWSVAGVGLKGTGPFVPILSGTCDLVAGKTGSLDLVFAKPLAPALLVLATASTPVPFFGGTLVPYPAGLVSNSTTTIAGKITLPIVWPAGIPSGTDFFFQYAIEDTGAVNGVALSNALRAVVP